MIGKTISHYKILDKIGYGGMGEVYKAEDINLKRFVALKFLPHRLTSDKEFRERFIIEAKSASSLQHNNICTIHEIDKSEDEKLFICMDYYEGETLKEKISKGTLEPPEAIDISIQMLEGLKKAHEKGIVHRDIKPANIFITHDRVVKILNELKERAKKEYISPGTFAKIYIYLNKVDEAYNWMKKGFEERTVDFIEIYYDKRFSLLFKDERFVDLYKRAGLPTP
ncbi:protein kinase [candidate division KSB1 bacterium]|nr:protein kinase [candidate division KSB1 bacterium]